MATEMMEAPEKIAGLVVWEGAKGCWNPDFGSIGPRPDGWEFVPTGDAVLTKKIKNGVHWLLREKQGKYSPIIGLLAPSERVQQAIEEMGGDEGKVVREQKKASAQENREKKLTEALAAAIKKLYPRIPECDVSEIIDRSRQPHRVGKAKDIYFSGSKERGMVIEEVARRAVVAHVRHKHTGYDTILERKLNKLQAVYWSVDYEMRQEAKWEAREAVAARIARILKTWQALDDIVSGVSA
jgi:hypothetical protein